MNKNLSIFFPYAMLFCLVVMWGSAFAALKISLETISPLNVMSLRLIIGSITILLFFLILNIDAVQKLHSFFLQIKNKIPNLIL